ncbi:hypothetical protein OY671_008863, partial [Metschnikowia pulcherrima]
MDFLYTEEQRMSADSSRRSVDQAWTRPQRRAREAAGRLDEAAWGASAESGVSGSNIPQEAGGFGEVPASSLPVHSESGRGS